MPEIKCKIIVYYQIFLVNLSSSVILLYVSVKKTELKFFFFTFYGKILKKEIKVKFSNKIFLYIVFFFNYILYFISEAINATCALYSTLTLH